MSSYPPFSRSWSDEQRAERLAQERRALFVGMTRAMRGLLVVPPKDGESELYEGFDGELWNVG